MTITGIINISNSQVWTDLWISKFTDQAHSDNKQIILQTWGTPQDGKTNLKLKNIYWGVLNPPKQYRFLCIHR